MDEAHSPGQAAASEPSRRWPVIAGALLLIIALSVVRSPAEYLTRFTSERTNGDVDVRVSTPPGETGAEDDGDDREPHDAAPLARDGAGPAGPVPDGLLLRETRGGWRVEPGVEEAAALALLIGHRWQPRPVGDSDTTDEAGIRRLVIIEAVERPGLAAAVITLLIAPAGAIEGAPLHRIAVPILLGEDGASLGGTPWELPPPTHELREIAGVAVDDARLVASAREALDAAGIDGSSLIALEATDGWPFIARTAAGPHPWLRWHIDRFVVTGLPLHHAAVGSSRGTPG
jgi:hypothetical protein